MHTKSELEERLLASGIRPLKSLGQNFLMNPKICVQIVKTVEGLKPRSVVEIGPGLGALTDEVLLGPWKTTLVELDAGLVEFWKKRVPDLNIIHKDALHVDWDDLQLEVPRVLMSNLPYSIAASLVVELSSSGQKSFEALVLMFQKEVAERIMALENAEDYGMLSVIAQVFWRITKVVDAGPQDFFPVPHVGSRVLLFTPKEVVVKPPDFLRFVKLAFSQRRKKLLSNLASAYAKEDIGRYLSQLNLGLEVRAQELSPGHFVDLFSQLESKKK